MQKNGPLKLNHPPCILLESQHHLLYRFFGPQDVLNTVTSLPRTPAEAGIIPIVPVNLKRKLEYKNSHFHQIYNYQKYR